LTDFCQFDPWHLTAERRGSSRIFLSQEIIKCMSINNLVMLFSHVRPHNNPTIVVFGGISRINDRTKKFSRPSVTWGHSSRSQTFSVGEHLLQSRAPLWN